MLAEGGLEGFRRQVAFDGADFLHPTTEEEQSSLGVKRTEVAHPMPDTVAVGDLREARGLGQAVVFAGHARTRRDDLADLAGRAGQGFGQGRNRAVGLADHADFDAADRPADAGALAAEGELAGFAEEFRGGDRRDRQTFRRTVGCVRLAVRGDRPELRKQFARDRGAGDEQAAQVGQLQSARFAMVGDLAPDRGRAEGAGDLLRDQRRHERGGVGGEWLGGIEERRDRRRAEGWVEEREQR